MNNQSEEHVLVSVLPRVKEILGAGVSSRSRFISDYTELREVVRALKAMGKKIVLTKGVYDLIHVGHARYLNHAKSHGDILIVSIDTDELTRKRKGPNRPIVDEKERLEMLANLRAVDIIVYRGVEHRQEEDVEVILPDVLVTSSTTVDYSEETKMELREMYKVEIVTLQAQAETSTTARVRRLMIDGVKDLANEISNLIQKHLSQKES